MEKVKDDRIAMAANLRSRIEPDLTFPPSRMDAGNLIDESTSLASIAVSAKRIADAFGRIADVLDLVVHKGVPAPTRDA